MVARQKENVLTFVVWRLSAQHAYDNDRDDYDQDGGQDGDDQI